MKRLVFTIATCLMASPAMAQLPQIQLHSVFPPGGQVGTSVEFKVTNGTDIDELEKLHFNHPGIQASQVMQEVDGVQKPVDNTFTVTIEGNVPPGLYEVRAQGLYGISNPRTFVVGSHPEIQETEPNNNLEQANELELNTVVNGVAGGGADLDFYKLSLKQGQRVLATCLAGRIDSRMTAALELLDASGRRIAFTREQPTRDALLDFTPPADGDYYLKVHDFVYGGGADYTYRLCVHTGPYLEFVVPPAGQPGTTDRYTLYGRNLPGGQPTDWVLDGQPLEKLDVQISLPTETERLEAKDNLPPVKLGVDGISYVLETPAGNSNPLLIHFASAPIVMEQEPNNTPEQAQQVQIPVEFVGHFQERGDIDYLAFEAEAGQVYVIDVYGERHGNNADPYMILERVVVNDEGEETVNRITVQDDNDTNLGGNDFNTISNDPSFRFEVPADGLYRLSVRDRYFESRGDPRLVYRVCIREEQPDFRLVVLGAGPPPADNQPNTPGAIVLRKGDNTYAQAMVFRRDGFDGRVDVRVEGLPDGVTSKGASIGPGQHNAPLIFSSTENVADWFGSIRVIGKARVDDPKKVRAVEAAKAAIKPAADALPKLEEDVQKTAEALNQANEKLEAAKKAAADNPDNEGLKNNVEAAETAAREAAEAAKNAAEAKAAGEKSLADAHAAVEKTIAEQEAAAREVAREARTATVVWPAAGNASAVSRVSRSLNLGILDEQAPYQVTTDVFEVEGNQSRQILVPVKVVRRNGFDANVNLTFTGLPNNSNIQVENKPVEKDNDEQLLRVFLNNNAVEGTYTLYLKSQAQVSYSRNPAKAERAKAAQEAATQRAMEAEEAFKKAVQERDEAVKTAAEAAEAAKQAETQKTETEKKLAEANEALKKATEEKEKADEDAKAEADKKVTEAQAAVKTAEEEFKKAEKALEDAEKASKEAEEAKTKAETAAKEAEDKSKAAQTAKQAADKEATDAANAAQPKNVNVISQSTPIVLTVKKGPATLAAAPNGGTIKKGQELEIKVTVNRINEFEGPVTLGLPLPPNVQGLSADPVTIPADEREGVLTIKAAGDATEGQLANMVIRATMDFEGKAAVDVPINLTVSN